MTGPTTLLASAPANMPALTDSDGTLTYDELARRAGEISVALAGHGVEPGSWVGVSARADAPTVVLLHAIWRAGAVAAVLHPSLTPTERDRVVGSLELGLDVDDPAAFTNSVPHRGPAISTGPDIALDADTPQVPMAVVWTSGTEGRSRGVILRWESFHHVALASARRMSLRPADRWLLTLSPAHVGGLALIVRAAVLGSAVIARGGFDAAVTRRLMDSGAVSHASLVPTQLGRMLDDMAGQPLPASVRGVLLGGARAPTEQVEEAHALGLPVFPTYGMSETTSQVATATPEVTRAAPGSVGPPLADVRVRIGVNGEIQVAGPTLAASYVEGPLPLDDGWFRSGDLGRIDDDGRLYVTGRIGRRIVTGGVNVDPLEIEAVLRAHPDVSQACIVGVPDPEWGERVVGAIVPATPALVRERLEEVLRDRLQPAKRPKDLRFVSALPLGRSGKVDLEAVRSLFRDRASGP